MGKKKTTMTADGWIGLRYDGHSTDVVLGTGKQTSLGCERLMATFDRAGRCKPRQ
jgi:hypothetical protein